MTATGRVLVQGAGSPAGDARRRPATSRLSATTSLGRTAGTGGADVRRVVTFTDVTTAPACPCRPGHGAPSATTKRRLPDLYARLGDNASIATTATALSQRPTARRRQRHARSPARRSSTTTATASRPFVTNTSTSPPPPIALHEATGARVNATTNSKRFRRLYRTRQRSFRGRHRRGWRDRRWQRLGWWPANTTTRLPDIYVAIRHTNQIGSPAATHVQARCSRGPRSTPLHSEQNGPRVGRLRRGRRPEALFVQRSAKHWLTRTPDRDSSRP